MPKKKLKSRPKKNAKKRPAKKKSVKKKPKKKAKPVKKKTSRKQTKKKPVKRKKAVRKTKKKTPKKTKNKATKKKVVKKKPPKVSKKPSKKPAQKEPRFITHADVKKMKLWCHPVERMLKAIIVLSFIGLIIASYLIFLHYKPAASTICTFGERLNCDVVNKSDYSKFLGVPNAIIGALGYIYFIIISIIALKGYDTTKINKRLKPKHLNLLVILFACFGWLFSMYLLYIEKFVIHAYCIFCLASLGIITIIFIISIFSYRRCMKCRNILHKVQMKARGKMCRYC